MGVIDFATERYNESKKAEKWKDVLYWMAFLDGVKASNKEVVSEEAIIAQLHNMSDDGILEIIRSARGAAEALEAYLSIKNEGFPYSKCKEVDLIVREKHGQLYPYCPTCKNMSYGTQRCAMCGQPFVRKEKYEIKDESM